MNESQENAMMQICMMLERRVDEQSDALRRQKELLAHKDAVIQSMRDNMQNGMVEALITACEFKTYENAEHMRRLGYVTKLILSETEFGEGLTSDQINLIALAATLHDIGKVAIPNHILESPGELTNEEYEIVKTHTTKGAELLYNIEEMHSLPIYEYAFDIAKHHHERWDGSGYPDHLIEDEITTWSQAVSIADVYDALRSKRCYHDAFDRETTIRMIDDGKCGEFNPKLVICLKEVDEKASRVYDTTLDIDASELLI